MKKTACFCNIINVLNVTFDQFNVSMLNKGIHFFQQQEKKNLPYSKLLHYIFLSNQMFSRMRE